MASEKKTVEFSFKIDQTSLNNLKNAIKSITEDMQKLIATAANINRLGGAGSAPAVGSGGNVSPQGIQTAIRTATTGQNVGFGGIFSNTATAATAGAAAVRNATKSMENDIRSVARALSQPNPMGNFFGARPPPMPSAGPGGWLGTFQQGGPPPMPGGGGGNWLGNFQNGIGGRMPNAGYAMPGGPLLPGIGGAPIAGPGMAWGAGAAGQFAAKPQGGMSWFPKGLKGWAGIGLAGAAAVGVGYNELAQGGFSLLDSSAGGTAYASAEAKRGQMVEGKIRAMMKGDTRWLINKMAAEQSQQGRNDLSTQYGKLATVGAYGQGVGQAVGNTVSAVPVVGGLLGKVASVLGLGAGGTGGIMGGVTTAAIQGTLAENTFKHLDEKSKATAMLYTNMAQEKWQSELGRTVGFQLGTGISGLTYDPKTGKSSNKQEDLSLRLQAQGYDLSQWQSAFQGVRAGAGSAAGYAYADEAMRAAAQGYGNYAPVAEASMRLGYGNALARGAIGGRIEKGAGIAMGAGVLGTGFDAAGTTSGWGTLTAMQAGMGFTGDALDFNRVQQGLAGLKAGDALTTGALSPYQRGANTAAAIGINGGATSYSNDYLATGMTTKQIIDMGYGDEPLTANARNLGLTKEKIRAIGDASTQNLLNTWHDSGGNDAMSVALRAQAKSGGSASKFLQDARARGDQDTISAFGTGLSVLGGFSDEAGQGRAKIMSGEDAKDLAMKGIGGKVTGLAKDQLETNAAQDKKVSDTLKAIAGDLQLAIKALPDATKKMVNFGTVLTTETGDFVKSLSQLITSINEARTNLAKGAGKGGPK